MTAASSRDVFKSLADAGVRFIVVGGLAVNVHGLARMTLDIDLVVALEPGKVRRLFAALASLAYSPVVPVSAEDVADAATREGWIRDRHMQVLRFHSDLHPLTPVDVFVSEPFDFDREYHRALRRSAGTVEGVPIVSLDTLIEMKRLAGRPQDLADVEQLRLRSGRRD
jgi:hypothetical protein